VQYNTIQYNTVTTTFCLGASMKYKCKSCGKIVTAKDIKAIVVREKQCRQCLQKNQKVRAIWKVVAIDRND